MTNRIEVTDDLDPQFWHRLCDVMGVQWSYGKEVFSLSEAKKLEGEHLELGIAVQKHRVYPGLYRLSVSVRDEDE